MRELVNKLKEILKNRPNDSKGYNLLVENSARLGDFKTAYYAMEHIIQNINPTVSASDYSKLSELMIAATDGYISIEAENNLILIKQTEVDTINKTSSITQQASIIAKQNRIDVEEEINAANMRAALDTAENARRVENETARHIEAYEVYKRDQGFVWSGLLGYKWVTVEQSFAIYKIRRGEGYQLDLFKESII